MSDVQRQDCEGKEHYFLASKSGPLRGARRRRSSWKRSGKESCAAHGNWQVQWPPGVRSNDRIGLLGTILRFDCDFSEEFGASGGIDLYAAFVAAVILVLGWRRKEDRQECLSYQLRKSFGTFAALVSAFVFSVCFEEMANWCISCSPGWQDAKLIAFDSRLTGGIPPSGWTLAHPA